MNRKPPDLFRRTDLLGQIAFVTQLFNLMDLRFQPVNMAFFVFQQTFEELTRAVIALISGKTNEPVVHSHRVNLQREIRFQL